MKTICLLLTFFTLIGTQLLRGQADRHRVPPRVVFSTNPHPAFVAATMHGDNPQTVTLGDTSSGVQWGPRVKISPDDPDSNGGSYIPKFAVQGDTIHCVWFGYSPFRLPYTRSTDDGLTWEEPKDLIQDTSISRCPSDWQQIAATPEKVCVFYTVALCGNSPPVIPLYYLESRDRGLTWSGPARCTDDSVGAVFSASLRNDSMAALCVAQSGWNPPRRPRITRSTNGGLDWTGSPLDIPSTATNEERVILSPGITNIFHVGQRWFPNPEVVLQRSTDLCDTWLDSVALSPVDGEGSDMPEVAIYEHPGQGDPADRTALGVMWRGEDWGGAWFSAGQAVRLSYDNGRSWKPFRLVSDVPFGSSHSLAVRENVVAVSWTHEFSDLSGPWWVKARMSFDCGDTWKAVTILTPDAQNAGDPSIGLTADAVHVAWSEDTGPRGHRKWNVFYMRGELVRSNPVISPRSLIFDTSGIGCSRVETVKVENTNCYPLFLQTLTSDSDNYIVTPAISLINPKDHLTLTVRFSPLSGAEKPANLILIHDGEVLLKDTVQLYGVATTGSGGPGVSVTDSLGLGWQMISLPVGIDCPYALPGAFLYEGSYRRCDSLMPSRGYWLKFKRTSLAFSGMMVMEESFPVRPSWNIIGSISLPVAVSQIRSDPPGEAISNVFGYDGTHYTVTDTIYPGRGYWVKVGENVRALILSASPENVTQEPAGSRVRIMASSTEELPPSPPESQVQNPSAVPSSPSGFVLDQNYPNPFNPQTQFTFRIPEAGLVSLIVYDILGREVVRLVNEHMLSGTYSVSWNAEGYPTGIYYYRLTHYTSSKGLESLTRKLVLVR